MSAGAREEAALRRARLEARRAQLSPGQRQALESRLRGPSSPAPPPASPPARCLVEITPRRASARAPFFCVHPAGGDVLCFFPLARHLGAEQPFYGLQDPALESGAEPFSSLEDMARVYAAAIRGVQADGPYRLGGWSFGGLAAFEMARQLTADGQEVALLAVLDTGPGAPAGAGRTGSGDDDLPWLLDIAQYLQGLRGVDLRVDRDLLAPLPPEERLRTFVQRLQETGVVHAGQDGLAQLRRLLRVYRANSRSYLAYRPVPYAGPVTLFRAAGSALAAGGGAPDLGWQRFAASPVAVHEVPGGHITLLAEPNVGRLAGLLRTALDQ